jgi:sugar lactone lactonase YvrE
MTAAMSRRRDIAASPIALTLALSARRASAQATPASPVAPNQPRILVHGARLHSANGLAFDAAGRLYVASDGEPGILVLDPDTGDILARYGPDEGAAPDDLTFGPDGALYWTNLFTGEVGRRAPDGTFTTQQVAPGVNPITVAADGRLFVALAFLGDALYELDPTLAAPPKLLAEDLGFLNGFDWGADGHLYAPVFTTGDIVRIDVDAQPVGIETVADGFGVPTAVKFDAQGRLHVVDSGSGEVVRLDTGTGAKTVVATLVPALDILAFDARGRLFVSSNDEGFIVEVRPDGSTHTVVRGGMANPGGVAVVPRPDGGETVIVADMWTLRSYDGATGAERGVERAVTPHTVFRDGDHLVLTSWFANVVQVWDPATRKMVESYDDFTTPLNAIRFRGDLVIAELGTAAGEARVVRAPSGDPSRREVLMDATTGLQYPLGLAAKEATLWVGDWATGTIWHVAADGQPLAQPTASSWLSRPAPAA